MENSTIILPDTGRKSSKCPKQGLLSKTGDYTHNLVVGVMIP